jgi:hypothetical protein
MNFMGELHVSQGIKYFFTTSHPAFIRSCAKNPLWEMIRKPGRAPAQTAGKGNRDIGVDFRKTQARGRLTASFRYVGSKT